jgi:hypothetical protein
MLHRSIRVKTNLAAERIQSRKPMARRRLLPGLAHQLIQAEETNNQYPNHRDSNQERIRIGKHDHICSISSSVQPIV